jgi:hypothetical protein
VRQHQIGHSKQAIAESNRASVTFYSVGMWSQPVSWPVSVVSVRGCGHAQPSHVETTRLHKIRNSLHTHP